MTLHSLFVRVDLTLSDPQQLERFVGESLSRDSKEITAGDLIVEAISRQPAVILTAWLSEAGLDLVSETFAVVSDTELAEPPLDDPWQPLTQA